MIERPFWTARIEALLAERTILWLSGVRRVGKTVLCRTLPGVEYFDCELPRVRQMFADPESFLRGLRGKLLILDEIHRLTEPSELLKIAADHYPDIRIIATGSSALGISRRFRDTLTGRKRSLWLTPLGSADMADFGDDIKRRLLHGGLPSFYLAEKLPESDFQEWLDAFWSKDIQELFRLERRASFQRFIELLFLQSGGIFEATRFAAPCEISRQTVMNYLKVLEATFVAHVVRPFATHKPREILTAPRVYAFDTGFVCHMRGWDRLRPDDLGVLWEHYVLNELHARLQDRDAIGYWRDKSGREVDFVLRRRGKGPVAIECKWKAEEFDPVGMAAFRKLYPEGPNRVVAYNVDRPFSRDYQGMVVNFIPLSDDTLTV